MLAACTTIESILTSTIQVTSERLVAITFMDVSNDVIAVGYEKLPLTTKHEMGPSYQSR